MKRRALAGVSAAPAAGIAVTATMAMNAEAAWTSTWNVSASGWTPALATGLDGYSMIVWTRSHSTGKFEVLGDDGDGVLVLHPVVPKSTPPYSYTRTSALRSVTGP
ncbi:hypothetical protein ACFY5C_05925 [Streptomyces sp. NPDC012935]|uniref:hypothetical protein n=1 Tax=Streptomyces sp. NPDC012935 TaxID=3364857 RepID=UPI0036CDB2DC